MFEGVVLPLTRETIQQNASIQGLLLNVTCKVVFGTNFVSCVTRDEEFQVCLLQLLESVYCINAVLCV